MRNEELDNILEKTFRTEPDFQLPVDFSQKVTFSVVRHEHWKNDISEYISIAALILILFFAVVGLYYYFDKEFVKRLFSFVSENWLPVAFTVFMLNFVLLTDRVLLRLLFTRLKIKT